tara:strand:- start:172 stop:552 length:381 start_codon:yes stop_codon:yes gene_type:complete
MERGETMTIEISPDHSDNDDWKLFMRKDALIARMNHLRRKNKGVRMSMLIGLGEHGMSEWVTLPYNKCVEIINKETSTRFRNCDKTQVWHMKAHAMYDNTISSISLWPTVKTDWNKTKDNNWGEEE